MAQIVWLTESVNSRSETKWLLTVFSTTKTKRRAGPKNLASLQSAFRPSANALKTAEYGRESDPTDYFNNQSGPE